MMLVSSGAGVCSSSHSFSFHIIQLNGERNLEDQGKSEFTRWKRPGALNYHMDQRHQLDLYWTSCE